MEDGYDSDYSDFEETSIGHGEGILYSDHLMSVCEDRIETDECEDNVIGEGSRDSPASCKIGNDLGRKSYLTPTNTTAKGIRYP